MSFLFVAYVYSTSRAMIHMKSIPSSEIMNDLKKHELVLKFLTDSNLSWDSYVTMTIENSIIKSKQKLTMDGYQLLRKQEHSSLLQRLQEKYPHFFEKGEII